MRQRYAALALGLALIPPAGSLPAQETTTELLERGKELFEENCIACHGEDGAGAPPNFPALAGNANLSDEALIIRQVRAGKEAMPAFPDLSAEDIAAVATYVRNAWQNDFGPVSPEEAQEVLMTVEVVEPSRTIWDGVYTSSQAKGARITYLGTCAPCHGSRLNGAPDEADMSPAPPLAGTVFMRNWRGRTLAALFEYTRTKMPIRNPGQLSDQEYVDVIAYMLSYADAPSGSTKLLPDVSTLSDIAIVPNPDGD